MGNAGPALSVVLTIIDGGETLRRSLHALTHQEDAPPLEILVPWDASVPDVEDLRHAYSEVRFLEMGAIELTRSIHTAAGQHELYDRRRAAGLSKAQGKIVAILEDRGVPRADWARNVLRLHEQSYDVIGGAIECAPCGLLNWAFYVCDFGRYGLPFEGGTASWISDVNVSYKRSVIEGTKDLWKERFHEPIVHWALLERGSTLYLSPEMVVEHSRRPISLPALIPERFHWGRLFGSIRASHVSTARRAAYAALSPLLPLLLLARHGRTQHRKGRSGRYMRATPAILVFLIAWSAGEMVAYLTPPGKDE
jgi:hypothetical protein